MIEDQSNTHINTNCRLDYSTRNHLLKHLDNIERYFYLFYAQKVLLEGKNLQISTLYQ